MPLDPAERSLRARLGAHESWAKTRDRSARTAPARRGLMARFEREVDPEGRLPAEQRAEMARHKYVAHFQRLSLMAAAGRRKKREAAADPKAA
ncbi:hypothetical protein [Streptodolium elevatio]|uniref:DUF3263 domain-containing protein n=1 Tax=Streptodolium elevatio TaxID=3157996 RepID=A0ABV3DMA6_9ACTN